MTFHVQASIEHLIKGLLHSGGWLAVEMGEGKGKSYRWGRGGKGKELGVCAGCGQWW